jgi:CheY-like chemotaxis protein
MPMTLILNPQEFEQQLQNCLLHFYDYAYLQESTLVDYLIPEETTAKRIQTFRDRIETAIEKMRPPDTMPSQSKSSRLYNVLTLRYIEQDEIDDIIDQLAISRRQYYRELSRAITSLANILQEGSLEIVDSPDDVFTVQSEIASLRQHSLRNVSVNLHNLLDGVINANSILASNHNVAIHYHSYADDVTVGIDRALVRQLLLVLLSSLIGLVVEEGTLEIEVSVTEDAITILFHIECKHHHKQVVIDSLSQQETLSTLLTAVASHLSVLEDNSDVIQLSIPLRRVSILLIDDNPDVISLFRRLIDSLTYRLIVANDGQGILSIINKEQVDIIILDIMLPEIDGFELLQIFKSNQGTKDIPVVICSVLESEELAMSLGADAVLAKPPTKAELHNTLNQWI